MYRLMAEALVLLHFLFILFVAGGGLLVIRWPRLAFVHLPAAIWGAVVEIAGWICPLTPLENHFRRLGSHTSYQGDFLAQYLRLLIYPESLTVTVQYVLGGLVIVLNLIFYGLAFKKHHFHQAGENKHRKSATLLTLLLLLY